MKSPRRRPGESSQKHGTRFEHFWAAIFGVKPTLGSGNQWFSKMDVGDSAVLWSCKHTDADSFRLSKDLMREAEPDFKRDWAVTKEPEEKADDKRCGHCGGTREKPVILYDDSYSQFPCAFTFHRK
jgi:hypothetical protein